MDEADIESWYEEQKQKCMDDYLKELEASKNHDEAEKKYNERLNSVMQKYNKMMMQKLDHKESRLKGLVTGLKKTLFKGK